MSLVDHRPPELGSRQPPPSSEQMVAVASPTSKRRPLILLGALMVVTSALVAAWLVASASETHRVLVANNELTPGEPVSESDVRVVEVGGGLDASSVAADEQELVVGRYPLAIVPSGTLLQSAMFVSEDDVIPAGSVIVSAVLEPGRMPAGVVPGAEVELISTVDADEGTPAVSLGTADVFSVEQRDNDYWLSVVVDSRQRLAVATAAASGDLSVGVVG